MTRDVSESIDDYCESQYGHTNWAYLSTLSKKELKEFNKKNLGVIEGDIVFYWEKLSSCDFCGIEDNVKEYFITHDGELYCLDCFRERR
tara:strand:+ start:342 stop:608 length:267 start_codon:yes stop_codon:yes gene_type:complete